MLNKRFIQSEGSAITLPNNEIKDIIKVVKYLENRGILSKGTIEKIINQKGRFPGSLMRVGLPLMKIVLTPLPKNVLLSLGVTAVASATDAANKKNIYGSGMATLIFSNKVLNDSVKIVNILKNSGILIKSVSETK